MNKKMKWNIGSAITTLVFAGFAVCAVRGGNTQSIPFTIGTGGTNTIPCPGPYYGYAKMTNSTGTLWFIPSNSVSSGTLTDESAFGSNYVSVACVLRRSDLSVWCGTNSVTFPATNADSYSLTVYVKNLPPPPTNKQPLNLQILWQ
jgi:hypothetical protein